MSEELPTDPSARAERAVFVGVGLLSVLGLVTALGGLTLVSSFQSEMVYAQLPAETGSFGEEGRAQALRWKGEASADEDDGVALGGLRQKLVDAQLSADAPMRTASAVGGAKNGADHAPPPPPPPAAPARAEAAEAGPAPRQWFPESFLWRPLVQTDASGEATLSVTVPDTLTTWRVLALAHSEAGQQAGDVLQFDSTLPAYVDPVLPAFLYAGDVAQLPVQVVNTSDDALVGELRVQTDGALTGGGRTAIELPSRSSRVRQVDVRAVGSGWATLTASLSDGDSAERRVRVLPTGRPVLRSIGGDLAGPRQIRLDGPPAADPTTQEVEVRVFAGPLALLQAEVERSLAQPGGPGALGFGITARLAPVAAAVGAEVDDAAIRRVRLLAWQQVVQAARAPDGGMAADLLLALGDGTGHALADALRPRLVQTVAAAQRADGTWARQERAPLQTVLVQTAMAARVLPADREGERLRASGAIERYAPEITDPFTASVVLASGLTQGGQRERLEGILADALTAQPDGRQTLPPPGPGITNAWGRPPSRAEALAWATLALLTADPPAAGDLVTQLVSAYDARSGFGAGTADAIALEAVSAAMPGVTEPVEVVLSLGGREVDRVTVDPRKPEVPAVLVARPGGARGALGLRVEPEVPGLAWTADLHSWVPWTDAVLPGVEVAVAVPSLRVGRAGQLVLTAAAPAGVSLVVEVGLPAGTTVDEAVFAHDVQSVDVTADRVRLTTRPFGAGETLELSIGVRPAVAGTFSTAPLRVSAEDQRVDLRPPMWRVEAAP
ncbi:MAG: hypothetical protein ACI8PZ_005933 [Myxococcota bacterium]|jgi:hypothetical protein